MRRVLIGSIFGALLLTGASCGPSFQAMYEGDSRFEHCYALEENPRIAMQQKGECWNDWLRRYTYGQTRDRVEYAATRRRALTAGHELPTDEAMMHAAPGEGRNTGAAGPAPTSAFAPPPKTLGEADDGGAASAPNPSWPTMTDAGSAAVDEVPVPRAPLADCANRCGILWSTCKLQCERVEAKKKACEACDKSYKACIKACAK